MPLAFYVARLVPGDGYAGMAVANEQDAGLAWESLVRGTLDRDEREKNSEGSAGLLWADTLALFRYFHDSVCLTACVRENLLFHRDEGFCFHAKKPILDFGKSVTRLAVAEPPKVLNAFHVIQRKTIRSDRGIYPHYVFQEKQLEGIIASGESKFDPDDLRRMKARIEVIGDFQDIKKISELLTELGDQPKNDEA